MPADVIDQEMGAVREVGAPVHRLMGVPLEGCEDRHALGYPRQATFHPLKYLAGVAKACSESGVTFFRDSPVEEVTEDNGVVSVKTARHRSRPARGCRDQLFNLRPLCHSHENGSLPDPRDHFRDQTRRPVRCSLLGY